MKMSAKLGALLGILYLVAKEERHVKLVNRSEIKSDREFDFESKTPKMVDLQG